MNDLVGVASRRVGAGLGHVRPLAQLLPLDAPLKERDFLNWIIACAEATGWKVYHVPAPMVAARGGGFVGSKRAAGLPDLFLLHADPPRMIIAEVKGTGGKLSDNQREFLQLARDVAQAVYNIALDYAIATPEGTVGNDITRAKAHSILGVYAWTPEHQPIIETMLKSKVLA